MEFNVIDSMELQIDDVAVVTGYRQESEAYRSKLLAMGLTRGTKIRILKLSLLGSLVELEVRGSCLTLEKEEFEVLKLRKNEGGYCEQYCQKGAVSPHCSGCLVGGYQYYKEIDFKIEGVQHD